MPRRRTMAFASALAIAACTATNIAPLPADAAPLPAKLDWHDLMVEIDAQCDVLTSVLVHGESTDLRLVASAATAAAERLQLGYGPLEDRTVPGFARMAHDAESWLLQVALEARQAHGDIARELFLGGKQHCKRCHDAYDLVHG